MATRESWQRTRWCGEVRRDDADREMTLNGWVRRRRDHGGLIFVDLVDRSGLCQVVFDPSEDAEAHKIAGGLRSEYVISVSGVLVPRSAQTINPSLDTGEVELRARRLGVLNPSETPPFTLTEEDTDADEFVRLRYRYLDLRTPRMQRNLRLRHRAAQAVRHYMDEQGFWEIETPMLFRQTPEGARDYLVPSRVNPGQFYALPQSPQLMKQLLMVAGVERYYQLARCLRDEDLRRDRQPEHTQIDIEMSFVTREDILDMTEGLFRAIWRETIGYELPEFRRMTYAEAMDKYGTDKPDLRYGMELTDLSDIAEGCEFRVFSGAVKSGGQVKALVAPGGAQWGRMEMDRMTEELQRETRAKGLAWIALLDEGPKSPIVKFFSEEEMTAIIERTGAGAGDMVLMVADKADVVAEALDRLRRKLADRLGLIPEGEFAPAWVLDFPLFAWHEDQARWDAEHHPFCMPHPDDIDSLASDPGKVRAQAYDVVMNGDELGSGSIRIHRRDIQQRVLDILGVTPEQAEQRFGFLLRAFEYGTPPHGGIAPGFDRIVMWLCGEPNIREVMAFPKTQTAQCLMSGAPSPVDEALLKDLHIKLDLPPEE